MRQRTHRVAGILLAAGASTRMGVPKQLLPIQGRPMLSLLLEQVLASSLDKVVLVLGHCAPEIRNALGHELRHPRLSVLDNPDYTDGISSSIKAGLRGIRDETDHVVILLGDMPFLTADLIDRFLHEYLESGRPLGAVAVGGRRSHPVAFSRELYDELEEISGDTGARDLFRKYAARACLVEAEARYDDRDMDTFVDYERVSGNCPQAESRGKIES